MLGDYSKSSFGNYYECIVSVVKVDSKLDGVKCLDNALGGSFFGFDEYDRKFASIKSMIQLGKIRVLS